MKINCSQTPRGDFYSQIAPEYDLLNHILSFNLDNSWRSELLKALDLKPGEKLLDLCTGTGDIAIAAAKIFPSSQVIGLDLAPEMLKIAEIKQAKAGLSHPITFLTGNLFSLPFPEQSFAAVSIAFGIRNIVEKEKALREIKRVLKKGGKLLILEFSLPENLLLRLLYLFYLKFILPWLGGILTGNFSAYRYLADSIQDSSRNCRLLELLAEENFVDLKLKALSAGTVTLYQGILKEVRLSQADCNL